MYLLVTQGGYLNETDETYVFINVIYLTNNILYKYIYFIKSMYFTINIEMKLMKLSINCNEIVK